MDFTGRVAIVTGAGKGLGRSYALWLAERGCAVVANNRISADGSSSAASVVDEIRHRGGRAVAHEEPVDRAGAGESMVALALAEFGGADILIANAGTQHWTHFSDVTDADLRQYWEIHVLGTLHPLMAIWPVMLERGYGRIVVTSSGAGLWGQPRSVPYCASKAAVIGIARGLVLDIPPEADIRINVIAPAAYTPMSAGSLDPKWADFMSPDKVAPVVGWLASQRCSVNGAIYHTGAGRVRRVRMTESERLELTGDLDTLMSRLDRDRPEPDSSFGGGRGLMPELFADRGGAQ